MAFQCPICFDELDDGSLVVTVGCPSHHRFCQACLRQHAESRRFPRCPAGEGCDYELSESELLVLCGEGSERAEGLRADLLQRAVNNLGGVVHCPNPNCTSAVTTEPSTGRQRWECDCGWPAWCTHCRQPYHYYVDCGQVQPLRERWLQWVSEGRAAYNAESAQYEVFEDQRRALELAMTRHAELQRDEQWKANYCRECPRCGRVVQKMEGCNHMVCGEDAHGGNRQSGCGMRFDWTHSRGYRAVPESRPLPPLDAADVKLRGAGLRHPFSCCSMCNQQIVGPRFRCIHCPDFNLCASCDHRRAPGSHPDEHIFEILFKADYDLREGGLPVGTAITLADHTDRHGWEGVIESEVCTDVYHVRLVADASTRDVHRSGLQVRIESADEVQKHIDAQMRQEEARKEAVRRRLKAEQLARQEAIRSAKEDLCTLQ